MLLTIEYDDSEKYLCLMSDGGSGAVYPCAKGEIGQFIQQYIEDYCSQSNERMG